MKLGLSTQPATTGEFDIGLGVGSVKKELQSFTCVTHFLYADSAAKLLTKITITVSGGEPMAGH